MSKFGSRSRKGRALLLVGALAAAASCSSDSGSSDPTTAGPVATSAETAVVASPAPAATDPTTTDAPEVDTSEPAATDPVTTEPAPTDALGEPAPASGDPILVAVNTSLSSDSLGDVSQQVLTGYEVAVKYANEYLGGIGGHPIELVTCEDKGTPAGATDCANQHVEKGADVFVAPYQAFEAETISVLVPAGIAEVVSGASTTQGLTGDGVFVLGGGIVAGVGAMAMHASGAGVKNLAMVTIDVPAATQAAELLGSLVFGKMAVGYSVVAVPGGTPDMTPQLQSAIAAGADAFGVIGDATFCTSFFQAYQTLGLDVARYIIPTCVDPNVVAAVPDALAGSLTGLSRGAGPDDAIYAATLAKYGDGTIDPNPNLSSAVADGWGSIIGLVNLMKGYSGDPSPEGVISQAKAAKEVPIPLSGGTLATCDGTAIPLIKNICSAGVQMAVVDGEGNFSDYERIDAAFAYAP